MKKKGRMGDRQEGKEEKKEVGWGRKTKILMSGSPELMFGTIISYNLEVSLNLLKIQFPHK